MFIPCKVMVTVGDDSWDIKYKVNHRKIRTIFILDYRILYKQPNFKNCHQVFTLSLKGFLKNDLSYAIPPWISSKQNAHWFLLCGTQILAGNSIHIDEIEPSNTLDLVPSKFELKISKLVCPSFSDLFTSEKSDSPYSSFLWHNS